MKFKVGEKCIAYIGNRLTGKITGHNADWTYTFQITEPSYNAGKEFMVHEKQLRRLKEKSAPVFWVENCVFECKNCEYISTKLYMKNPNNFPLAYTKVKLVRVKE